jgi:amidase
MGDAFGLPVGLSFVGTAGTEGVLLRLAYAYEQATKHRKPPRFAPTADLGVPRAASTGGKGRQGEKH